jgi:hypothetical protein
MAMAASHHGLIEVSEVSMVKGVFAFLAPAAMRLCEVQEIDVAKSHAASASPLGAGEILLFKDRVQGLLWVESRHSPGLLKWP